MIGQLAGLAFRALGASKVESGPRADFYLARGLSLKLLRGFAAMTVGRSVLFADVYTLHDRGIRRHELVHVQQWRDHGALGFLRHYLGDYLRARRAGQNGYLAYLAIGFEVAARESETDARLPSDP